MNDRDDEIVAEIRRSRETHAESLDYDLKRITEGLQQQERESGARVIQRAPRKPQVLPKRSSA